MTYKKRNLIRKQKSLKRKIIRVLEEQGFKINPHLKPAGISKRTYRRVQKKARLEQISNHRKFLKANIDKMKKLCKDGKDIVPEKISLELRNVKSGSLEEVLFRWWDFIWWSIPYQRAYGRQMRFLLWDKTHSAPFGLIGLQSPVLRMGVRDISLGIPNDELDTWVNRSMSARRIGALPPYNELLGGKMVALSLLSNEIRKAYKEKYKDYVSIIKGRKLKSDLLFITTTSAFGKSSLYNRLKYDGKVAAEPLGYTQGAGSFHIPEWLYEEIIEFLDVNGVNIARCYGHGPSRKLKLISHGFKHLGLPKFEFHGIKREFYLFPFVNNLREVIQKGKRPEWVDYQFNELADYWKRRWAIPRSERVYEWKNFKSKRFFKKTEKMLKEL